MQVTEEELAAKVGKASVTISTYETGTRPINIDDLIKLANILSVDICFFFKVDPTDVHHREMNDRTASERLGQMSRPMRDFAHDLITALISLEWEATDKFSEYIEADDAPLPKVCDSLIRNF